MAYRTVVFYLLGGTLLVLGFQNCGDGKVAFIHDLDSQTSFGSGTTRKISLDPNLAENRPPIHLSTIVDNSYSTSLVHKNLQEGFEKAIDQVDGFNVVTTLHTTSHDPGADKSSTLARDVVVYNDDQGNEIELPFSEKDKIPANTNYVEKTLYELSPSFFPEGKALHYSYERDDFSGFKEAYNRSIATLGVDGADNEQGLCTLMKSIENKRKVSDPDNSAYHVYVLATNEDDSTDLSNCPLESSTATKFVENSEEASCSEADPGCKLNYQIDGNPSTSYQNQVTYKKPRAYLFADWEGTRIKENFSFDKIEPQYSATFQKKVALYTYSVVKMCLRDNIPVPCDTASVQTKNVVGSCSGANSSYSSCSAAQRSAATSLFSINDSQINACQIKCSDTLVNTSIPAQDLPKEPQSCAVATEAACSSQVVSLAAQLAGGSAANVVACKQKCSPKKVSGSYSAIDRVASCTPRPNSDCNADERAIAATRLGVSPAQVNSCARTCNVETQSNSRQYRAENGLSCAAFTGRSCDTADKDFLIPRMGSRKIAIGNFTRCDIGCREILSSSKTFTEALPSPQTCTNGAISSCSDAQLTKAAQLAGVSKDLVTCSNKCLRTVTSAQSCKISNLQSPGLCENASEVASLCLAQGVTNLNMNSCRFTGGKKRITTTKAVIQPTVLKSLADLLGVPAETSVPTLVAKHLNQTHGSAGFFTSFFVYPSNDSSCVPTEAGLTTGAKYEELAEQLGESNASVHAVCASDYSPALDSVIKIAIDSVLNTFNLDIEDDEKIYEVFGVALDGSETKYEENTDYVIFKKTIKFQDAALLKDIKSLEFTVWKPVAFQSKGGEQNSD